MPDIISDRKDSHLRIAAKENVQYQDGAGFEDVQLAHCALPEMDRTKIDTSVKFLGKKLSTPLLITGMTGGTEAGGKVNYKLAAAAEKAGVALGLGSQRPMLRDGTTLKHYAVRKMCPSIPLIGNIGAANLREYPLEKIEWLVSSIEADALNIHLNPLQEAVQPEGETNFEGVLDSISRLCDKLSVPVIAKETGAGISGPVAAKLFEAGVKFVEVSGRGGTSWSKVEYARGGKLAGFGEWGYPTVPAICESSMLGPTIASGGIRDGLDVAKSIALGAKLAGAALPFFQADDAAKLAQNWSEQLRTAMFLCGARNISELNEAPLLISGKMAEICRLRGVDVAGLASRQPPALMRAGKRKTGKSDGSHGNYL